MGLYKKKKENMHTQRRYATCFDMPKKREEIKDAYPKKVCHMLRHVKKKERKDSPLSKKKKKRDGPYEGDHTSSTKNIHTLAHLD